MMYLSFIACLNSAEQPSSQKITSSTEATPDKPPPLPAPTKLRAADTVAAADLDGDGTDEQIFFENGTVYWNENREPLEASIHDFIRVDRDSDGREELLIATGFSKDFRSAPKTVFELSSNGLSTLWSEDAERNQISDIALYNNEIFISTFAKGTQIQGGWIRNGTFVAETEYNMAVAQQPYEDGIIIGRLYGDEKRSYGDLRVKKDGTDIPLQNFRGIREMTLHDVNSDGQTDVLVSDGWHFQYGSMAQARLVLYLGPDFTDVRTIANFDDDYTINQIEVERRADGTTPRILAQASHHVYVLTPDTIGWGVSKISRVRESGRAVFCYSQNSTGVLVSGPESQYIPLPKH